MIGIVVAAHGDLATALVNTATGVVPGEPHPAAVAIFAGDDSATYEGRLYHAVEAAEEGEGVLVLTDMFGGTPSNVGMTLYEPGKVEVLTGVNLPMLLDFVFHRALPMDDLVARILDKGRGSITQPSVPG